MRTKRRRPGKAKGVMINETSGILSQPTSNESPSGGDPRREELVPDSPPRPDEGPSEPKRGRPRGFAAMDRKLVSEIARKGGKAAHTAGTAHEFTSDEAREAGRKGGRATHAKRRQRTEDQQKT
jgi:general stress protein YciG